VQDTNFTEGDSFSDEVQINLNMLGSLMLDWVGGEVDGTDIVTIYHSGTAKRVVKNVIGLMGLSTVTPHLAYICTLTMPE